jgi:hypothetical protein
MSAGNWGGSASGGGIDFQAATSAICLAHMATGTPLSWSAAPNDTPVAVSAETGGAGDDIALTLANGDVVEVQAKRRLVDSPSLWDSLLALCLRVHQDAKFHGVLAVGPTSSIAIRDQLARDIIRIGQARTDDLSALALKLMGKLSAASLPPTVCSRVRIQTVHVLEQDGASFLAAVANLAHITTQPRAAWERLNTEGLRLIRLRGRHDTASIAGLIPALRTGTSGGIGPAVVATQLLEWTLETTKSFTIPAIRQTFSMDDDWIELKAFGQESRNGSLNSLKDALIHYHQGFTSLSNKSDQHPFDAESLGYFVRQCVIVAGPGMGKSQLMRRIARLLARKGEPSLLVRLRPLAERMRTGETFIEAAFRLALDASPVRPQEVEAIGLQNLTFLLDGLDESGREQEEIAQAATALAASFPQCRIVITTRPIGYETSVLSKWTHYELASIEKLAAIGGVERLVAALADEDNCNIRTATVAAVRHLDYVRGNTFSAKSPFLVALLASLSLNGVVAVASTVGLYGQLFALIERMTAVDRKAQNATPAVLKVFLNYLGWELTTQPYADAEQVMHACAKRLVLELGESPLKSRILCDEALAFWERSGIVERVRFKIDEAFTFVHKTFGEYAAAQYLVLQSPSEQARLLSLIEPDQQWNEVLVFAAAMGFGPVLVKHVLDCGWNDSETVTRLLRWAKYSREPLGRELATQVMDRSWNVIAASHSSQALRTGVDLVAALDKFGGAIDHTDSYCNHEQWWTALVGSTCFAHTNAQALDFSALLTFMDTYVKNADRRTLSGGLDLGDPTRHLWEPLLLSATREAVRRGIDIEEQRFIDRLQCSDTAQRLGFMSDLRYILKQAGVTVPLPEQEDLVSKYSNSEVFRDGRKNQLALLTALTDGTAEYESSSPPLLHLSAFWYGIGMQHMDISADSFGNNPSCEGDMSQLIKLAARASAHGYNRLIAEAQAKIAILRDDEFSTHLDGLIHVDAPLDWKRAPNSMAKPVIRKALLSSSECVVELAVNLAMSFLTPDDAAELVPQVLAEANGIGTAGAAYIAIHLLGKERARELLIVRLKQPLDSGSQYLFHYLAEIWVPELDHQINEILEPALFFGPRTAQATLSVARVCGEQQWHNLALLLATAYDHWLKNEEPYPISTGVIPITPRGAILELLIEKSTVDLELLFTAVKDTRTEVSKPAITALLSLFETSEGARNELVRRLGTGGRLTSLLATCLRAHVPFSERDSQEIAGLLGSGSPQCRYAAIGILDPQYLACSTIDHWAEKLLNDPYQKLRDKGLEILGTRRSTTNDSIDQKL